MNGSVEGLTLKRKTSFSAWDACAIGSCGLLTVLGVCLWAVSGHSLTGATAFHGQILGVACVCLGGLGMLASSLPLSFASSTSPALGGFSTTVAQSFVQRVSLPLRMAMLVGLALSALGSLLLLEQVSIDQGSHCVLAEASVRINHLEEAVTKLKHDEMLTQVFFRLNEIDDLMTGVAQSSTAHAELRSQTFHLQLQDRDVIRERVDRLRHHAEQLLDDMSASVARTRLEMSEAETQANLEQDQAGMAAGNGAGSSSRRPAKTVEQLREERARMQQRVEEKKGKESALQVLERRIEAVQSVLQYMDARSHDAHAALSFEEYEVILNALLEGAANLPQANPSADPSPSMTAVVVRENLAKDKQGLGETKGAFERRKGQGSYDKFAGMPAKTAKEVADRQARARAEWEARFFGSYEEGAGHTNPSIFSTTLAQALDTLPQHCLDDVAAFRLLRWLGLALLLAQTATGYVAATSLATRIAGKRD